MNRKLLALAVIATAAIALSTLRPSAAAPAADVVKDWPNTLRLDKDASILLHQDTGSSIELLYTVSETDPPERNPRDASNHVPTLLKAIDHLPGGNFQTVGTAILPGVPFRANGRLEVARYGAQREITIHWRYLPH